MSWLLYPHMAPPLPDKNVTGFHSSDFFAPDLANAVDGDSEVLGHFDTSSSTVGNSRQTSSNQKMKGKSSQACIILSRDQGNVSGRN